MQNPNAIGPEQSLDKYKRVNANPQLVMTWWAMHSKMLTCPCT